LPVLGFDHHGFWRLDCHLRHISVDQNDLSGVLPSPSPFPEEKLNGQPVPAWLLLCPPPGHNDTGFLAVNPRPET